MFPFKTPPHAGLYRGWVLLKKQRGDELIRPFNQFQIIVKKFKKAEADARTTADNVLSEFSVLQYLGTDRSPQVSGQIICLTDGEYYYSVMKFCGYDLGSYVFSEARPLSEERVRHLFRQLLAGMRYLQSHGVCHRDLSIENLVYDEETRTLSIIDFGMSLVLPRYPDGRPYLIPPSGPLGKKHYIPPEILENQRPFDGFRSDSWNLGIILFLVLTKKYPMTFANRLCPYFKLVAAGRLRGLLEHWNLGLSAEVVDLLCCMLRAVPTERYSLEEISNHPWVREGAEVPVGAGLAPLPQQPPAPAAEIRGEETTVGELEAEAEGSPS
jgi:serine/threonine protein kinase